MNSATIVQKLWNYCNVLRDDGMSYGDYVEQLTYLLFLKMADERSQPPYSQPNPILRVWMAWVNLGATHLGTSNNLKISSFQRRLESSTSFNQVLGWTGSQPSLGRRGF